MATKLSEREGFVRGVCFRMSRMMLLPDTTGVSRSILAKILRERGLQITATDLKLVEEGRHKKQTDRAFWLQLCQHSGIPLKQILEHGKKLREGQKEFEKNL